MRSKKRNEWASRVEALSAEMVHANNAVGQCVLAMMSGDPEGADASYQDANRRVDRCRAGYLNFHGTYNPGNVKSRDLVSFLALDAGLRRMLGGITVQLSATTVASGSTDDEELEFVGEVALEGRKVTEENYAFMQNAAKANTGMMVQVNEVSQTLEAHHEQLMAMMEKLEDVDRARRGQHTRQSGEVTSED